MSAFESHTYKDGQKWKTNSLLLSCKPRVTVISCFVYKVIRGLKWIDHLCINSIHRIGLIHKCVGGGVQAWGPENSLDYIFFSFFLVLNLFYILQRGSNGFITEKTILFQGSRGGPTFSRRGWGWSKCLFL